MEVLLPLAFSILIEGKSRLTKIGESIPVLSIMFVDFV